MFLPQKSRSRPFQKTYQQCSLQSGLGESVYIATHHSVDQL